MRRKKFLCNMNGQKGGGEDVNSYYKTFDWK